MVKALCEYPCDVFAVSAQHENALHSACAAGHFEVVDFLTTWVREKPLKTYQERKEIHKYAMSKLCCRSP